MEKQNETQDKQELAGEEQTVPVNTDPTPEGGEGGGEEMTQTIAE